MSPRRRGAEDEEIEVRSRQSWDHVRFKLRLLDDPALGAHEHSVYLGLLRHADSKTGRTRVGMPRLAGYSGVSVNTVRAAITVLKTHGYVVVEPRPGRPSIHWLTDVDALPPLTEPSPRPVQEMSGSAPDGPAAGDLGEASENPPAARSSAAVRAGAEGDQPVQHVEGSGARPLHQARDTHAGGGDHPSTRRATPVQEARDTPPPPAYELDQGLDQGPDHGTSGRPQRLVPPASLVELVDPCGPVAIRRETGAILDAVDAATAERLTAPERRRLWAAVTDALDAGYPSDELVAAIAASPFRTEAGVMGELRKRRRPSEPRSVGDRNLAAAARFLAEGT